MWSLLEKFLSLIVVLSVLFQCLTLLIRSKNPVFANFTEAKRNRQDAKNKCCILLLTGIYSAVKLPRSIFELFQIM
jgi:hypothetical protein